MRGHEEGVGEGLLLLVGRVGAERVEIYKFSAEGEDGLVQDISETPLR